MKHARKNKRFGRKDKVRLGLTRSLIIALIENERIKTTEARAKAIRPMIEKLITKALGGNITSRRLISAQLGNHDIATKKLVDDIAPRFKDRSGGYTRIIKLPPRTGDAAAIAIIEFVESRKTTGSSRDKKYD